MKNQSNPSRCSQTLRQVTHTHAGVLTHYTAKNKNKSITCSATRQPKEGLVGSGIWTEGTQHTSHQGRIHKCTHTHYIHLQTLCVTRVCFFQSICTLQNQAEGLLEVMGMKPSQASLEVHREVFGSEQLTETPPPSPNHAQWSGKWNRQSVRRDAWDAVASAGYVGGKKAWWAM